MIFKNSCSKLEYLTKCNIPDYSRTVGHLAATQQKHKKIYWAAFTLQPSGVATLHGLNRTSPAGPSA